MVITHTVRLLSSWMRCCHLVGWHQHLTTCFTELLWGCGKDLVPVRTCLWGWHSGLVPVCNRGLVPVCNCLPTYRAAHHVTQTNHNVPNQTLVYVRQRHPCTQQSIKPVNVWASKGIAAYRLDGGEWSFSYLPLYHLERACGTVQTWSWVGTRINMNDAE